MTPDSIENIPQEMRERPQWVCHRDGDKVPIDPKTGRSVKANDPTTWGTFEEAVAWATGHGGGVGYEFAADDPFCGIDLDHVIGEGGTLTQEARAIVDSLDTYTEVSPSGSGLHLIARAEKPEGRNKRTNDDGTAIEMYGRLRYFRMTGNVFEGHGSINDRQEAVEAVHARYIAKPQEGPSRPASTVREELDWDSEVVAVDTLVPQHPAQGATPGAETVMDRMRRSSKWGDISRLWEGDTSSHGGDHSAADQALCNHLAYYCDRDEAMVDELFRRSGLMRDKWDEVHDGEHTYGWMTIHDAVTTCRECYSERHTTREPAAGTATKGEWRSLMGWIDDDVPEDPELIAGLLRSGEKSILYGASKAGKSWVSMHLAASLAAGIPFLGHECVSGPVRVWYLNLEIHDNMFRKRMRGIWRARGIDRDAQALFMWEPRSKAVRSAADAESATNDLLCMVSAGDFVVLDCLYMMLNGGDENSAQTMQPMMRQFDRLLTEGGCSGVWLVHHQAKGAAGQKSVIDRGAGSGVSSRFVDNVFSLNHLDADPDSEFISQASAKKLHPRRLSCVMRNAEDDEDVDFLFGGPRLVPVTDGNLADFYVTGSPQANGRHAKKANEERAERNWAKKVAMVEAAIAAAEAEGAEPTRGYVVNWCTANHSEYGVDRTSESTLEKWFQPSFDRMPFVMDKGSKTVVAVDG
ncbi:AAA family ATPase [Olsenella sp. Marseille-P4559]|uniref:phage NrS-1 polymerase family protein n=1 Tax=Olsenella sp. Marseille-P4559 TaxID=2364795 RepID=UPI001030A377|nr:AAA family ATPase [Olsenella sp. Marseille-P4559]